jgi:predicted acetyltransferase
MLFAIDVVLNSKRGKYVYAVATDERMRGKGYMRILFDKISNEYKKNYDFLCLRPMNDGLFSFYEKLGFERRFKKSKLTKKSTKNTAELKFIEDIKVIKDIRKKTVF